MWHFLFALSPFLAILINFRFLSFSGISQTFSLSKPEKLAGSGEKIIRLSPEERILAQKQKKRYFIIYIGIYIYIYIYIYLSRTK